MMPALPLDRLLVWLDPVERPGPEAMAVDEWLLGIAVQPVLRVYGWQGDWGSVGYFGELAAARTAFPGIEWVRRWTGGGTVDHRADWTYTLTVPAKEPLARMKGAESYRAIHSALAGALEQEGITARLSTGDDETGAMQCFENPVSHDLVAADGRKLAGAGQRRTKHGLLHQGSVAATCDAAVSIARAERLAAGLADHWEMSAFQPPSDGIAAICLRRYAHDAWTQRR
jgi:lipoate-protein ligase A